MLNKGDGFFLLCMIVGVVTVAFLCWVLQSHIEARVFTELTDAKVSTWQAMWVELRVTEPYFQDMVR